MQDERSVRSRWGKFSILQQQQALQATYLGKALLVAVVAAVAGNLRSEFLFLIPTPVPTPIAIAIITAATIIVNVIKPRRGGRRETKVDLSLSSQNEAFVAVAAALVAKSS